MKPRVCLITPPSPFLLEDRVFAALGILKVAAVLERDGYQVDHLDLCGVSNFEDVVRQYSGADIFGITSTTPQFPSVMRIAKVLREIPERKLILGGPHPTLIHSSYKRGKHRADVPMKAMLENFDVVVAGDGEDAIFSALSQFAKGVIDADDPKSPLWQTNQKFTDSPWPARHLLDISSYHYSIEGEPALHLIGQLGCLTKDTQVVLESGVEISISDIHVGDKVLGYEESTGKLHGAPVVRTHIRHADDIWELEWDNGTKIRATSEHPIFTEGGWETVASIRPNTLSACL